MLWPGPDSLDSLIIYLHSLCGDHVAEVLELILIKMTLSDWRKARVSGVEDIELLAEDLSDVALKTSRSVGKTERHDLVLEVTVPKRSLIFITFSSPHPMVCVCQVQLCQSFDTTKAIERLQSRVADTNS